MHATLAVEYSNHYCEMIILQRLYFVDSVLLPRLEIANLSSSIVYMYKPRLMKSFEILLHLKAIAITLLCISCRLHQFSIQIYAVGHSMLEVRFLISAIIPNYFRHSQKTRSLNPQIKLLMFLYC